MLENKNSKSLHPVLLSLLAVNCFAGTTSHPPSIEPRRSSSKNVVPFHQTTDDAFLEETSKPKNGDPLRPINKVFFAINHQLYRFIFRALAKVTTTSLRVRNSPRAT